MVSCSSSRRDKCVSCDILLARIVLDDQIISKQLSNPLVLRYGRQTLVEDELEAAMISMNSERLPSQVRSPIAYNFDEPNELSLICR
jgi:hypothetical protein